MVDPLARSVTGATTYDARDSALSLWVHATLVESTLALNEAWLGPLDAVEAARFYAETLPIAQAFGISESVLPPDLSAFRRWWDGMLGPGGPIQVTPTARDLAAAILAPPLGPLAGDGPGAILPGALGPLLAAVPRGWLGFLLWPALGLLPARVREGYGIHWTPGRRVVAAWLGASWRAWSAVLPPAWRTMPWALEADRRIG